MKISFSLFIIILSLPSFACKMLPLPPCQGIEKKVKISPERLKSLREKLAQYQTLMDEHIVPPARQNSCFNNHAALHFMNELSSPSCPSQLAVINGHLKQLENTKDYVPADKKEIKKKLRELLETFRKEWKKTKG